MADGVESAAAQLDQALNRLEQAVSGVLGRLDEAGRRVDSAMAEIRAALSAGESAEKD